MDVQVSRIKVFLDIEEAYDILYHISWNEPQCPTNPPNNEDFKNRLIRIAKELNNIMPDHMKTLLDSTWIPLHENKESKEE